MSRIAVLGAGMMGSALAVPLSDRGHDVRLVGTHLDGDIIASLEHSRVHPKLRLELPARIRPFGVERHSEALEDADVIALGVSSAGVAWAADKIRPFVRATRPVFMITKGLSWDGVQLRVLPDVVQSQLPAELRADVSPAAIAGPCIAGELARRVESCVVLSGRDVPGLERLADLIRTDYYHVVVDGDVVGVEVCAALKNAYAMGIGFGAGLHTARGGEEGSVAMHNYESAVFAQAVHEMRKLVALAGGQPDTASGLAGVGDLDVTNNGGRTGRFGRLLGMGLGRDEAIARMEGATLECLEILSVMRQVTRAFVEAGRAPAGAFPLLDHLVEVALDGAPVHMPFARFFR